MIAQHLTSSNNAKKRRFSSMSQIESPSFAGENNTSIDSKRIRPVTSKSDEQHKLQGVLQRAVSSSASSAAGVDDSVIPSFQGSSCGCTNLWERKCSILEEELSLRVREKECLKLQLDQERQLRKIQEVEVQHKLAKIQMISNEIDHNKAAKTVTLEEQLEEEKKIRKHHEDIIHKQRMEIQKLIAASAATKSNNACNDIIQKQRLEIQKLSDALASSSSKGNNNEEAVNQSAPASPDGDKSAATDTSIREQLIKSRRKQLELVKIVEGWKQKAMELKSQLDMVDQSRSIERKSKIAERRRLQTAEQLLQISKAIPPKEEEQQQNVPVTPSSERSSTDCNDAALQRQKQYRIGDVPRMVDISCHGLATAPKNALKFDGNRWIESAKDKYPSRRCRHPGCTKRVRTFCKCSPGYWRCQIHVEAHIAEGNNGSR